MKKHYKNYLMIICLILLSILSTNAHAQKGNLVLSFSGKNAVTNEIITLESIYVLNLTEGCDTTLYGETPFLYLTWPSGIDDNIIGKNEPFSLEPNYPNPFSGTTNFKINIVGKENIKIILYDVNSSIISEFEKELNHGLHTFKIGIGKSNVCFLSVSNGKITKSNKLVSRIDGVKTKQGISYLGIENNDGFKSTEEIASFVFKPGDQLSMKATAAGYYNKSIYDNPTENTTYTFELQPEIIITLPTVTTSSITGITQISATSGGTVSDDGGAIVTARGVCWSINSNPTISDFFTTDDGDIGSFVSYLTGLSENTTYYVRAYATNSVGTAYGNELTFTTAQTITIPILTTQSVTEITQNSATSGGSVTDDGGATVIARGVCWSTSQNPTINDNNTVDGNGLGSFVSYLTGLSENTTYYIRAYAINSVGTAYGNELTFTSGQTITTPVVTTQLVTDITQNSATSGGNVTDNGGATVIARGVCWSTSQNPTINDNNTVDGSGIGTFISYLTGLSENTTYYVRAYATNSVGTSYGNQISFITLSLISVITYSATDITQNSATSGGNVTDDGGFTVTAKGVCWSTSQNPTINDNHTVDGSGIGTFVSYLTGLSENTTYYVRAYGTNSVGTSYGNQISFITLSLLSVNTYSVTNITQNSATSGGNVTNDGGSTVTAKGVCWSISQNPTINDNHTVDGSGLGTFISYLTGLSENTTYYERAYAINSTDTAYGNEVVFSTTQTGGLPCPGIPTVTYEGQVYNTVLIGNQCWFKENLNVGILINGSMNMSNNGKIEKYCYENDPVNCEFYGGLYQWNEIMEYTTTPGMQGICPAGWHIPTDDEWKILEGTVDSQYPVGDPEWDDTGYRGYDVGLNLKSTSGWHSGGNGSGLYGFSAMPSGFRIYDGAGFDYLGLYGWSWSSTEHSSSDAWDRGLYYFNDISVRFEGNKTNGISVRCLKD
jgi:uncharacterized protein (TIGR02145 family)